MTTDLQTEITKAIAAHGQWKMRLRDAISSGASDITVDQARLDNVCAFGKWLSASSDVGSPHWKEVKKLHADFHREAARILQLALSGCKDDAAKGIGLGSQFGKLSADLTRAMTKWKESVPA